MNALPLRAIRLRSGGRCGCTACLNDELVAEKLRDVAVVASVISPARAAQGEGAGRVEAPARVITRASAFSTSKLAPVAALGMGTGAVQLRVGVVAAPVLSNPSTKGQMMGAYFLVLVPVRDLAVNDWVADEHGSRRVTKIERYKKSAFITFSDGPNNWYHESELFPTERLS